MASTAKPASPPAPRQRWPWLIVGVLFLGLLVPVYYAIQQFSPAAERFQIDFDHIEITPTPAYVPSTLLHEVQIQAGLPRTLDLRAPELPAQLAVAFRKHPWIESVGQVTLQPRRRLAVRLVYRRPVAMVALTDKSYLVDRQSVLLPTVLAEQPPAKHLTIIGAPEPRGPIGQPWGSAAVEAAARLANVLEPERERLGLTTIIITPQGLTPELRLRTTGGTEVIWQGLGSTSRQDDTTPEEKLRRLTNYVAEFGSLEKPAGPYVLDVRPAGGMLRKAA